MSFTCSLFNENAELAYFIRLESLQILVMAPKYKIFVKTTHNNSSWL